MLVQHRNWITFPLYLMSSFIWLGVACSGQEYDGHACTDDYEDSYYDDYQDDYSDADQESDGGGDSCYIIISSGVSCVDTESTDDCDTTSCTEVVEERTYVDGAFECARSGFSSYVAEFDYLSSEDCHLGAT